MVPPKQILEVPAVGPGAQTKFSGHKNSPWNYRAPQRRCGWLACPSHVVGAEAGGRKISFGEDVISLGRRATCPSQRRSRPRLLCRRGPIPGVGSPGGPRGTTPRSLKGTRVQTLQKPRPGTWSQARLLSAPLSVMGPPRPRSVDGGRGGLHLDLQSSSRTGRLSFLWQRC